MLPPPMGPMAHRAVPFNRRERRRERSRGGLEVGRNVTAGGGKGPRGNRVEKGEKSGRDPGWRAKPLPLAPGLRQPLKDGRGGRRRSGGLPGAGGRPPSPASNAGPYQRSRSEEHTSELQSRENLVCRLLLEKK